MTAPAPDIATDLHFPVPIANIIADVAYQMRLRTIDVVGPGRTAPLIDARAAIVWVARELIEASNCMMGRALGGRRHGVIEAAYQNAALLRDCDPAFRRLTERLLEHYHDLQED